MVEKTNETEPKKISIAEQKKIARNRALGMSVDKNMSPEDQARQKQKQKDKLMTVLKAVSAMRLTREDKVPDCTVVRAGPPVETESGKMRHPIALAPPGPDTPNGFLYQGSVGAAFNKEALQATGITHILTVAANLAARYPKDFVYK